MDTILYEISNWHSRWSNVTYEKCDWRSCDIIEWNTLCVCDILQTTKTIDEHGWEK